MVEPKEAAVNRDRQSPTHLPHHEAPVDANDMKPTVGTETPETEAIDEDSEPLGGHFV